MKQKIMILMTVFLLAAPAVLSGCPCNEENTVDKITAAAAAAINSTQEEINNEIESAKKEIRERIQSRNLTLNQTREEVRERAQQMLQSENLSMLRQRINTGLENALTKVQDENARQRLQTNLERFQERYQQRIQRFENITIEDVDNETGAVQLKARQKVRFFGFIKGRATKRFNINTEGQIKEKAPWYRFLYTEVDEEETGVNETE